MSKLGRRRIVGVCLAAAALVLGSIALVAASLETGKTFHVPDNCRIVTPNDRRATLADLKVGDVVHIRYRDANGTLLADRIVVRSLGPVQQGESPKPRGKTLPPPKPGNENVRATIIGVNLTARTITIAGKAGHKAE
jgi:hypothetical protein